jgi:hypothetical protein
VITGVHGAAVCKRAVPTPYRGSHFYFVNFASGIKVEPGLLSVTKASNRLVRASGFGREILARLLGF